MVCGRALGELKLSLAISKHLRAGSHLQKCREWVIYLIPEGFNLFIEVIGCRDVSIDSVGARVNSEVVS